MIPLPPIHTERMSKISLNDILPDELVICSSDATEERGRLPVFDAVALSQPSQVLFVESPSRDLIKVNSWNEDSKDFFLKDADALSRLMSRDKVLLDISGFQHHVWAPLLKAAIRENKGVRVLYAEPDSYKFHPSPSSDSAKFDLTQSFEGLAPLPGFAKISDPEDEEKTIFVAFLGFEGNRPEHLYMHFEPEPRLIPIVGVPGFQIEYPAYTVACNRQILSQRGAHSQIRFARASCPFEVVQILNEIQEDYPDHYIYLAAVGTKPHSLGAVWFAMQNPNVSELLFDYPIRKSGRTNGVGTIHIYTLQ